MKRPINFISLLLVVVLVTSLVLGCSGSSGGGNSASDDKVYSLSFTIHDPSTSVKTQKYMELADKTREATNGKVDITVYPGGTLVAATDVAEAVLSGTSDMGWIYTPFFAGQYPLTEIISMPMSFGDGIETTEVLLDLYQNQEAVQNEWKNYKVFSIYAQPSNMIFSTEPINSVSDLRGLNIRCAGTLVSDVISLWGGSPIAMGPGDIYEAINKNTLQGYVLEWTGTKSFNLDEVINYCTDVGFTTAPFVTVMNLDTWNSLPEEYQQIMEEIWCGEDWSVSREFAQLYEDDAEAGLQRAVEQYNVEIIEPTGEDLEGFKAFADDYVTNYCEKNNASDLYEYAVNVFKNVTQ